MNSDNPAGQLAANEENVDLELRMII